MSHGRPLCLMLLCAGWLFTSSAANAAEEKAPAATAATPAATAPKPDSDNADSGMLQKGTLSIHDGSTVRPSTEYEAMVLDLVYRCNEAIRNNNLAEAELQLKIMTQFLPKESLTLLRMRAWYAMSAGKESEARQLYRQVLDRMVDDENAGINLAILEARGGRIDEAKEILNNLANRNPDSEQINAIRQAFGLTRQ